MLWTSSRVPDGLRLANVDVHRYFHTAILHRAADFARFEQLDFIVSQLVLVLVFAVYARRGARLVRESAAGAVGTGMLLGMLGFGIAWLARLPFGVAAFWWQRRHHLAHEGYTTWAVSNWSALGGQFLFVSLALLIVIGSARRVGDRWWLVAAPAFVALTILSALVQPYLTAQLHPLGSARLVAAARTFEHAEHVANIPVVVQDVRRETSAPNAEAVGLGPGRRIILWDTLLDGRFASPQIEFVIAHEIGHHARNHLWKYVGWSALFLIPGAFIVGRVTRRAGGMARPEAVPLALFVVVVLQLVALPLRNAISRHVEAEADWMALNATGDPAAGRALFVNFTTHALAEPDPPVWAYLLTETHPTIAQRIAMADAWQARIRG